MRLVQDRIQWINLTEGREDIMIKYVTKLAAAFLIICGVTAFGFTTLPQQHTSVAEAFTGTSVHRVPIGKTSDYMVCTITGVTATVDGNYYTDKHIDVELPRGYFKVRIVNVVGGNNHSVTYLELARNIKHPGFKDIPGETYLVRIPDLVVPSRVLGLTIKEMQ